MFVDIKDGEESSQVNCQNSNAANEARDRTPSIAQLELHWHASVRQELSKTSSLETVLSGPEPDSAGTIRAISRDHITEPAEILWGTYSGVTGNL